MKHFLLLTVVLAFSASLIAQTPPSLSPVAKQLFTNVTTKLSSTEKNEIAKALGFVLSGKEEEPFAADKESKEYSFAALVLPTDMNKDGKEEVFVSFGNSYTSGNAGTSIVLFIKNADGKYVSNLGFPGMVPDALATSQGGYADLLIGLPGFTFPIWRWNGKEYVHYKSVSDNDYEKLKKTNIETLSKTYVSTLK